jgi:hypothetical protein
VTGFFNYLLSAAAGEAHCELAKAAAHIGAGHLARGRSRYPSWQNDRCSVVSRPRPADTGGKKRPAPGGANSTGELPRCLSTGIPMGCTLKCPLHAFLAALKSVNRAAESCRACAGGDQSIVQMPRTSRRRCTVWSRFGVSNGDRCLSRWSTSRASDRI